MNARKTEPAKSRIWICAIFAAPFLFAVQPIVSMYASNQAEIFAWELISPMIILVTTTAIAFYALQKVFHDLPRSAVILSLFWFLFFAYGFILPAEADLYIETGIFELCWIGLLFGILCLISSSNRVPFHSLARFFAVAGIISTSLPLISSAHGMLLMGDTTSIISDTDVSNDPDLPHIFYIITDEHARADSLKKYFDYDESPFIDSLKDKGFYIAEKSTSNYAWTAFSLPSSLNMDYLDALLKERSLSFNQRSMRLLVRDSAVTRYLRQKGYNVANISTHNVSYIPGADLRLDAINASEFQLMLLKRTPVSSLFIEKTERTNEAWRQRMFDGFEMLKNLVHQENPTFTFAHFLTPHEPFLFDKEGNLPKARSYAHNPPTEEQQRQDYIDGYREAVFYTDKKLEEAISYILAHKTRPVVIVLQSDHGSALSVSYKRQNEDEVYERMAILNAYYFPDQDYHLLNQTVMPVNSFRIIFNTIFGETFTMLKEENHFSALSESTNFYNATKTVEDLHKD